MPREIPEADWKVFRQLRTLALDRMCQRVLTEIDHFSSDTTQTSHQRYLAIFRLIQERDEDIATLFSNPRRSSAFLQLACIAAHDLLSREELDQFSQEIRDWLERQRTN